MTNKQLEIPKSIIILCNDDPVIQERLVRERRPNLVAGYAIMAYNKSPEFSFNAIVNCHHSQFWNTLTKIIELMPEPITFSIGDYGNLNEEDGVYSKRQLIKVLNNYSGSISNDTEIQMLFNHQNESSAFQLYVSDCKFFEIYGSNDKEFRETMLDCNLPEIPDLATIDEFPRTMTGQPGEATKLLLGNIRHAFELI